LRSLQKNKQN